MSLAYRCEVCDAIPRWTLVRIGDVVTTWACGGEHLDELLIRLQRPHEVTQIQVTHTPKSHEWAEIERSLRRIVEESAND